MQVPRGSMALLIGLFLFTGCQRKQPPDQSADKASLKRDSTTNPPQPLKSKSTLKESKSIQQKSEIAAKSRRELYVPGPSSRGGDASIPQLSLPLPQPTSFRNIPLIWLTGSKPEPSTLGAINVALDRGLAAVGLSGSSRYYVENGFAVAARIEQIDDKGQPLAGKHRFDLNAKPRGRIWQRLFLPKTGRWRMLLIVVTDRDLKSSGKTLSREEGIALLKKGAKHGLPTPLAEKPITPRHECTVFVYEFHQKDKSQQAEPLLQSTLSADDHLKTLIAQLQPGR